MDSLSANGGQVNQDHATCQSVEPQAILNELLPVLHRLDLLLEQAIQTNEVGQGADVAFDLYRGFYIDPAEAARLLKRTPGASLYARSGLPAALCEAALRDAGSRLARLQREFGLSAFDVDLIVIALAPEIDLRYERIYAYLQDDVSRRRPSVDLALNLLCANAADKLARRVHFAPDAPLVQQGLIHLIADRDKPQPPLLAYDLRLDEQIVTFLIGQQTLDSRLASCCRWVMPQEMAAMGQPPPPIAQALTTLVRARWTQQKPVRVYLHGPRGNNKRSIARAVAAATRLPLLEVNLAQGVEADTQVEWLPRLVLRAARLRGALIYLDNLDALLSGPQQTGWQRLMAAMSDHAGVILMTGTLPWPGSERTPTGVMTVACDLPTYADRRAYWQAQLAAAGVVLPPDDLDILADRFRLTFTQITETLTLGIQFAQWRAATTAPGAPPLHAAPSLDDLFAAARTQTGHDLAALVQKLDPVYTWEDIVLPPDSMAQLREICRRVAQQQRVLAEWGFGQKLSRGKGIHALFTGASGTGKTMAAEIIAKDLGLDLYRIDLSSVVSKYIGETEKNLDRIFTAAAAANAILFFDEADALFGKRSEVKDAHDRYANIEISYLLQKMEEYEGVVILATNLRNNLDSAFVRRMAFIVQFPQPDETDRLRIWQTVWPQAMPLAPDLDLAFMARQFKLSGGNIKNIALAAAFFAADDGQRVTNHHLMLATRRELQKMGKMVVPQEFGSYAHLIGPQPS